MESKFQSTRDIIIRTDAWERATDFYSSVLGLPVTHHSEGLLGFNAGELTLYVERGAQPHGPVLEFLVPDVEEAKRKLLATGCAVVEEDASVPRCYIRDPFGLVFNIGRRSGQS